MLNMQTITIVQMLSSLVIQRQPPKRALIVLLSVSSRAQQITDMWLNLSRSAKCKINLSRTQGSVVAQNRVIIIRAIHAYDCRSYQRSLFIGVLYLCDPPNKEVINSSFFVSKRAGSSRAFMSCSAIEGTTSILIWLGRRETSQLRREDENNFAVLYNCQLCK